MFKNLPLWSLTPEGYQLTFLYSFYFISLVSMYVQCFRNGTTSIGRFIKTIIIIIINSGVEHTCLALWMRVWIRDSFAEMGWLDL